MTRTRMTVGAAAAAAVVAAAVLLGGVLRESPHAQAAAPPGAARVRGTTLGTTDVLVQRLQEQLRSHPSAAGYASLGFAYEQRARETGNPSYYTKADGVLHRSLALARRNPAAVSGLGSLALSRHRFREALALGEQALALDAQAGNYGIVGDALTELGRYDDAFRAFDTIARTKPGLPAYTRVSYARELIGDVPGAIRAMRLAIDAATGAPESIAWTHVQLGKLYWSTGRVGPARREFRVALSSFPGYVHALDALALVEAARGRTRRAIELERQAVNAAPLPQFVAALGDLYAAEGRPALARRQYGLMAAIRRLLAASGVRTDLETALFQVDHKIEPRRTLVLSRLAQRQRPSIDGDDVLAWALERNGRCSEALAYSRRALRLGTQDALKFFHRGMIERCLGHHAAGRQWLRRALALNPHFSILWAAVAREASR
jgi:tetratricopeptide (TPR) repeat protein